MRKLSLLGIVVLVVLMLLMGVVGQGQESRSLPRDLDMELEVITLLNRYRIRDGRGPLMRNSDLDYLAHLQAEYMQRYLPFTEGEIDYHTDQFGDGVARRAELIDWPSYGFVDAPFVGEIAAYFPTAQGMMNFWNNSADHREDIYAFGYREVGVAVLRNRNWYLAFVVFGARPEVLPVMYDAQLNKLLFTTDQSPFIFSRFVPTQLRILDEADQRLHAEEWLPWRSRMDLPEGAGRIITVVYSDGLRQVRTTVDLAEALVFPADRRGTSRLNALTVATGTPRATVTPMPPTPTFTPSPAPRGTGFDIRLEYNGNSLALINQSGGDLNLTPLSFLVPGLGSLSSEWVGEYAEVALSEFPDQFCLQLWSNEQRPIPPDAPDDCRVVASSRIVLSVEQLFWATGDFRMVYFGAPIATCNANLGICEFDLPE